MFDNSTLRIKIEKMKLNTSIILITCLLYTLSTYCSEKKKELVDEFDFKILTYNVQARPFLDDTTRKLPAISPLLNEYDIAGVQELFENYHLLLSQTTHGYWYYFDDVREGSAIGSGLLSLSSFPIVETNAEHYELSAEVDVIASKGVLMIRIDLGGEGFLDVYNTHMQAGASDEAQEARASQAAQLIDFIKKNSSQKNAIILHGDFNMGPHREGKTWLEYDPNHYSSEQDMLIRTQIFDTIPKELELQDLSDELFGPTKDHIDRIMFRSGEYIVLEPISWEEHDSRFVFPDGEPLSDSTPVVGTFHVKVFR